MESKRFRERAQHNGCRNRDVFFKRVTKEDAVRLSDGYTTGGGFTSVDEEYAQIRRPRRAHSHSPRKSRRVAPSPSSRQKYEQRPMSPLARPTRSPPKRRLYESQWPTDFARVVLTRLFLLIDIVENLNRRIRILSEHPSKITARLSIMRRFCGDNDDLDPMERHRYQFYEWKKPVKLDCCEGHFCEKCFLEVKEKQLSTCPLCRATNFSGKPSRLMTTLLDSIHLKCPAPECSERIVHSEFDSHKSICPFLNKKKCPSCSIEMKADEHERHVGCNDHLYAQVQKLKTRVQELEKTTKTQTTKIENQRESVAIFQRKYNEATEKSKKKDADIKRLNKKIESISIAKAKEINLLKEKLGIREDGIQSLTKELADKESSPRDQRLIRNLQAEIQELKKTNDNQETCAKVQLKEYENSNAKLREEIKRLKEQLEECSRAAKYKETNAKQKQSAVEDKLRKEIKDLKQSYSLLKASQNQISALCSSKTKKIENLEKFAKSMQEVHGDETKKLQSKFEAKQQEKIELENNHSAAKAQMSADISIKTHQLNKLNSEFDKQALEIQELRKRLQEQKKENETLAGLYESERKAREKRETSGFLLDFIWE
ncbi:Oidioi.mRNA.OKI2018_I69.chr2.g6758.t1.cds [Oikopleura dioica]|uniref:Oidioi.mRNA.OKI2018_I69.chr2.g6758.t1.cds n=1 Tax=Oikopleura dioica TaxID=34765 RepID=A0ABN7T7V0_OIKDI|nr:Oidioi.mRNA.OKI2018_I69.chr2.g6758.t1.cds [Oikopleura dioica]